MKGFDWWFLLALIAIGAGGVMAALARNAALFLVAFGAFITALAVLASRL